MVDPKLNSPNLHHKDCLADSKENYHIDKLKKNCGNYKSTLTRCSKSWLIITSQIQKCEFRASSTLGYWPDHDLKIVTMAILLACKRLALSSLQLTINKKKKHEWTKTNWNNFQLKIYMYYKHVLGRSHWVPAHPPPPSNSQLITS